jgi:hypothetical protein
MTVSHNFYALDDGDIYIISMSNKDRSIVRHYYLSGCDLKIFTKRHRDFDKHLIPMSEYMEQFRRDLSAGLGIDLELVEAGFGLKKGTLSEKSS